MMTGLASIHPPSINYGLSGSGAMLESYATKAKTVSDSEFKMHLPEKHIDNTVKDYLNLK